MASTAQYLADQLLGWLKHSSFVATPTTSYLGLFTTLSTIGTQGTEVSGGSYARVAITNGTDWAAIADGTDGTRYVTNANDLVFPTATADWGDCIGWELLSASSAGNRWFYGELNPHQFVPSGSVITIPAGSLRVAVL
jgi:hypothetical protein